MHMPVWHDPFICVTWFARKSWFIDDKHLFLHSVICVTNFIHIYVKSLIWNHSFVYLRWLALKSFFFLFELVEAPIINQRLVAPKVMCDQDMTPKSHMWSHITHTWTCVKSCHTCMKSRHTYMKSCHTYVKSCRTYVKSCHTYVKSCHTFGRTQKWPTD